MLFLRSNLGGVLFLVLLMGVGILAGWFVGGTEMTQPHPGKCLVLEEKYCAEAEPAYYKDDQLVMIGFRLPPGTPIFAPFTGTLDNPSVPLTADGQEQIHRALGIYSDEALFFSGADRPLYSLIILLADESKTIVQRDQPIKQGAVVARIPEDSATLLGKYNLLLAFGRFSPDIKMFANNVNSVKASFGL